MSKKEILARQMLDTATGGDQDATGVEMRDLMATYRQEPGAFMQRGGAPYEAGGTNAFQGQRLAPSTFPAAPPASAPIPDQTVDALLNRPTDPMATGVQPAAQQQQQRGGGGGVRLSDAGFGWNVGAQDFNPNGYRPNESRSTQVGKYGGAPLFAATVAWPNSVVASRMDSINTKRAEIAKAIQKFDPMAGVEDVNAPEYRDSFQRGVMDDIHGHMGSVIDQWGEEEGYRRLMSPASAEGRSLRERGAHWTTVSRQINQATKSADAIIEGTRSGTLQVSPELFKQAEQLRHKLGERAGNHDPEDLAKNMTTFNANVSLVDQLGKDKVVDMLKESGTLNKFYEKVNSGDPTYDRRFSTLIGKKTLNNDNIIDALTDSYYRQYQGDLTRDQVKQMVSSMAPKLYEEDVVRTQYSLPKANKGSEKEKKMASLYQPDSTALPTSLGGNSDVYRPTFNLMGFVSEQGRVAPGHSFRDGNNTTFMHPERLMDVDGQLVIVGKQTGMPRTAAEKAALANKFDISEEALDAELSKANEDPASSEAQATFQKFGLLQDKMVPLEGQNEALLNQLLGVDIPKAKEVMGYTGRTEAGNRQKRGSAPTGVPVVRTKEEYDALPVGAKYMSSNGKEGIKRN